MLELQINEETTPPTFTVVTDDSDAELARVPELLKEADWDESEFGKAWAEAKKDPADMKAKVVLVDDEVAEVIEVLSFEYPQVEKTLEAWQQKQLDKAEARSG